MSPAILKESRRAPDDHRSTALVLAATLAACGADEPASSPAEATTPAAAEATAEPSPTEVAATVAPANDVDELQAAADKIGCTGFTQSPDPAPYVDRWGTCDLDGGRVQLYLIPDDANYASFMDASASYGVTEAWVARVGSVVAAPDDQTKVEQIRAALGG